MHEKEHAEINKPSKLHRFEKTDFHWLILFPFFAIFHIFLHESSHAIAAVLKGGKIIKIVIIPYFKDGKLILPHCNYISPSHWLLKAAPFIVDTILIAIGIILIKYIRPKSHKLWLIVCFMLLWIPYGDVFVNYVMGLLTFLNIVLVPVADVSKLFLVSPPWIVHVGFISVLTIYGWQIIKIFVGK